MIKSSRTAATAIAHVHARQIFDSRGRPTVEVDVITETGTVGRAAVPSGASTGSHEAWELRDGGPRYAGLGVGRAVEHVNTHIAPALTGRSVTAQRELDTLLTDLDGTGNLHRLGANAVLGVSLALARAAAAAQDTPLHRWLATLSDTAQPTLPMPMVNIFSGGLHANRGMDVQDFLAVPASSTSMEEALVVVGTLRSTATDVLQSRGLTTLLADEGGLSPGLATGRAALELMIETIERAGHEPGTDVVIAIDLAAHSFWDPARKAYHLAREGRYASTEEMIDMVADWVADFPVASVEDALDEEDWDGWAMLTGRLGTQINLIGDDFFTTNLSRVQRGVDSGCANGVLIKVNQNGTLSGTLDVVATAQASGLAAVISARSGETEDAFISDLAVGTAAGQIKIGSMRCSDRLAKYNQLVRIAEDTSLPFAKMSAYPNYATRTAPVA